MPPLEDTLYSAQAYHTALEDAYTLLNALTEQLSITSAALDGQLIEFEQRYKHLLNDR